MAMMTIAPPKCGYFSSMTAEVCYHLRKLTSVKMDCMYQGVYSKVKNLMKQDVCMKFYDSSSPNTLRETQSLLALDWSSTGNSWYEL